MARRRPWRTHVVSLYRRMRHLLLRFLCLREAAILPFGLRFSGPKILYFGHGFSVCTSATAYSGTLFTSRWSAMEYRRCQPPCARFIASDLSRAMTSTVSVISVWGFCMHARRFMGFLNANFAKISVSKPSALGLRCLKRSHLRFPIAPRRPPRPLLSPRPGVRMLSSRLWRVSRKASPFLSLPLPSMCARIHLLWARGRAFTHHWEARAELARWAPRVSSFETRRAFP